MLLAKVLFNFMHDPFVLEYMKKKLMPKLLTLVKTYNTFHNFCNNVVFQHGV
jgi:hypothetical protein